MKRQRGVNTLAPAPDRPKYRLGDLADVPVEGPRLTAGVSGNPSNPNLGRLVPYVYGQSPVSRRPIIASGRLAR
jgi:hypothetical protein